MTGFDLIRILALFISITGVALAFSRLALICMRPINMPLNRQRIVFSIFIGWVLARGVQSLVPLWGFFIGLPTDIRLLVNAVLGGMGLVWGWPFLRELGKMRGPVLSLQAQERWILGAIGLLLVLYIYRVTVPWGDDDEANAYGYLSKLIGGGYSFADILVWGRYVSDHAYLFLSQSWDGLLFGILNDPWGARLNRLADLLLCCGGIFSFLRIFAVSRPWALAAVAGFLSTPELCYAALSLKPDAPTMMFELGAFLLLAYAFLVFHDQRSFDKGLVLCLLALACASFALGNRMSGIIPFLLVWGSAFYFTVRCSSARLKTMLFVFLFGVLCFTAIGTGYIFNIFYFHNPFYPAQGAGPFAQGAYLFTVSHFKELYNINGLPPGILQAYLLFSVGVGVELFDKVFHCSFLPMAQHKTISMGWPYPFLLAVFVWGFFIRGHRVAKVLGGIFLFQFVMWSLGVHYSRLFLASYALCVMVFVILADHARGKARRYVAVFACLAILSGVLIHGWWTHKRFFGSFLFSVESRHKAVTGFLETKDYGQRDLPTLSDTAKMNRIFLSVSSRPSVAIVSDIVVFHVLFDKRISVNSVGSFTQMAGQDFLIVNPRDLAMAPWFTQEARRKVFPYEIDVVLDCGWKVYAASPPPVPSPRGGGWIESREQRAGSME